MALDPYHWYWFDLRFPGRTFSLRRCPDGTDVHHHVFLLRSGYLHPGIDSAIRTTSGTIDAYLSKFDSDHTFLWVNTWGGEHFDYASGLAVDIYNNPFMTGSFSLTADFQPDSGTELHTSNGGTDAYLCRFLWDGSW